MEGLKNMGLKRCFFLLSVFCLVTALLLTLGVYLFCGRIAERYPQGGIAIDSGGTVTELAEGLDTDPEAAGRRPAAFGGTVSGRRTGHCRDSVLSSEAESPH